MLYAVAALLFAISFGLLIYAAARWVRPNSPAAAWLFVSYFALLCVLVMWFWG
jgi:hypothetical protein